MIVLKMNYRLRYKPCNYEKEFNAHSLMYVPHLPHLPKNRVFHNYGCNEELSGSKYPPERLVGLLLNHRRLVHYACL